VMVVEMLDTELLGGNTGLKWEGGEAVQDARSGHPPEPACLQDIGRNKSDFSPNSCTGLRFPEQQRPAASWLSDDGLATPPKPTRVKVLHSPFCIRSMLNCVSAKWQHV
jgi:hypothetical protein